MVAIDGKTLRRSYDRHSGKTALHMVSAWASGHHMRLGQVKTEDKSNEVAAIPKLLEVLEVAGCIVSCDAMGCQRDVAAAIRDQGVDYVLILERNQGELRSDVASLFDRLEVPESCHESVCGDHGRVEVRRCEAVEVAGRGVVDTEGWPGLRSVCRVESERHVDGEVATETRYFVSSLEAVAWRQTPRGFWRRFARTGTSRTSCTGFWR